MIVLKFGGTSVGNAANIKKVARIVNSYSETKIVVLSAVAGTTNALVHINELLFSDKKDEAIYAINELEKSYHILVSELFTSDHYQSKGLDFLKISFDYLRTLANESSINEKIILAQGEIISTHIFDLYQAELGKNSKLISALDFMSIN